MPLSSTPPRTKVKDELVRVASNTIRLYSAYMLYHYHHHHLPKYDTLLVIKQQYKEDKNARQVLIEFRKKQ
jgi:hypothetical protein